MRDEFAGSLSGGQRKLLEMARALMTDPTLIMLDEPMAGVNPALKQSLLGHIKELKAEGRTVLFVEHDMDMVHEISDWVVVMAGGRIIAEGTAVEISGKREVIDAYLGAHHDIDLGAMSDGRSDRGGTPRAIEVDDRSKTIETDDSGRAVHRERQHHRRRHELVAGYVPGVNILNGCDLVGRPPGEFVGIIGPNGAGKSTLLKAVLGLVTVRSGIGAADGDDITGQPAHQLVERGVGFVPQTNNVFPSLTVRENLEMGCFLQPEVVRRTLRVRHRAVPAARRARRASGPARSRAASARWWRWVGR